MPFSQRITARAVLVLMRNGKRIECMSQVNERAASAHHHTHDEADGCGCGHDHDHDHHHRRNAVAEPYVRTLPKVGRNDPCPCGSGKKYKKCCLV
jgi:uncharacterized protein YecA (UPF0149 family)